MNKFAWMFRRFVYGKIGWARNNHFPLIVGYRNGDHVLFYNLSQSYSRVIASGYDIKLIIRDRDINCHERISRRKRSYQRAGEELLGD
ncbi:hypothetical protein D3C80_806220 [compost metagenome]